MLQSKSQGVHAKSLADDNAAWHESLICLRESKQEGKTTRTCAVAVVNLSHCQPAANHACLMCMIRLCKTPYLRYCHGGSAHTSCVSCLCLLCQRCPGDVRIASEFCLDKLSKHFTGCQTDTDFGRTMSDVQPLSHAYVHTYIGTYIHSYTRICTYIHRYAHTFIYIHTYIHEETLYFHTRGATTFVSKPHSNSCTHKRNEVPL